MTRKTLAVLGVGTAAVLLLSGFAWAGPFGGGGHGGGRGWHAPERAYQFLTWRVDDALDELEATDAQRARVNGVKDRLFQAALTQHEAHRATRGEFVTQLASERPDAQRLHALVDARVEAMRALAHQAVDGMLEVHGSLTPAQRAEVAERFERHGR
jgi:Spy/CpxP family protein refolding chaperone